MSERNFWHALAAADSALSEVALPRETERRLQRRLGASMARRRMRGPAVLAFLAACLVGGLGMIGFQRLQAPRQLEGLRVEQSSRDLVAASVAGELQIRSGAVTLFDDHAGVQLRVARPVTLKREARGVRVVRGEVEFQVNARPKTSPTRMLVSHGEIEVHGTRFHVKQRADGGEVTLFEGSIVFRCADGREVEVKPGQTLGWPLPAKDEQRTAPEPAAVKLDEDEPVAPLVRPPPDADWRTHDRLRRASVLLERIPRLRASGEEVLAIRELEEAMGQDLPAAARERLSFELGDLLTLQWSTSRACRHWKDHAWRYPAGKYDEQVQAARRELGCR